MIDNAIILGGGTAGLITAIILKKKIPHLNITLIKSDSIGIIGVGEGSTEIFKHFQETIAGLDLGELIEETAATYKVGIKFTNWNGDGKHYFHSVIGNIHHLASDGYNIGVATQYLDDIVDPGSLDTFRFYEPYKPGSVHQFHFDTFKLNQYLQKVCLREDIKIVEDTISDIIQDTDTGLIKTLVGEKANYQSEFFVDCSGFKRMLINKVGGRWKSNRDQLPMNHAIAFPTEYQEDIPLYTESTALSSGWMWRIPTQERFGNGYVFDDNFINAEQAQLEAEKHLGFKVNVAKDIKFEAGALQDSWIKNVAAVGLSSSFIEPLEASSIGSSIFQGILLAESLVNWNHDNQTPSIRFNHCTSLMVENIIDFVQLHYITKRRDSEFWKNYSMKLTPFNQVYLDSFKNNFPHRMQFEGSGAFVMFKEMNFAQVIAGLEIIDKQSLTNHITKYYKKDYQKQQDVFKKYMRSFKQKKSITHRDFLGLISNAYVHNDQ